MRRAIFSLVFIVACTPTIGGPGRSSDDLTATSGHPRTIEWDSFVYVDPNDRDEAIARVIARQVKSSLGPLRQKIIGIADRGAQHNLDSSRWVRELVNVVDAAGKTTGERLRVRYHYADTALVGSATDP